jgi:hypothetical protein
MDNRPYDSPPGCRCAAVARCVAALLLCTAPLLSQTRHIGGIVLDSDGNPVSGAQIGHTGNGFQAPHTDSSGRFELETKAAAFVIRKAGFRSERVPTQDATGIHITLHRLQRPAFPACPDAKSRERVYPLAAAFQFPKIPGIKSSRPSRDVDYVSRRYYVETKSGREAVLYGHGPSWTLGVPENTQVWQSVYYDEVAYDFAGFPIVDARGQLSNGNRWRYVGMVGESASHSGVDEEGAKTLDKLIDGACLKLSSR